MLSFQLNVCVCVCVWFYLTDSNLQLVHVVTLNPKIKFKKSKVLKRKTKNFCKQILFFHFYLRLRPYSVSTNQRTAFLMNINEVTG